jgi:hypothetical protein
MRNVLDKSCRHNQSTHFMFNNSFPKMVCFLRQDTDGNTVRSMHVACWISKCTSAHGSPHDYALIHTTTHKHTHTHTHREICNTYCFSTATMDSRKSINVTLYVQGGSNMIGTNCDLYTHKSVPVIFEPPFILPLLPSKSKLKRLISLQSN